MNSVKLSIATATATATATGGEKYCAIHVMIWWSHGMMKRRE